MKIEVRGLRRCHHQLDRPGPLRQHRRLDSVEHPGNAAQPSRKRVPDERRVREILFGYVHAKDLQPGGLVAFLDVPERPRRNIQSAESHGGGALGTARFASVNSRWHTEFREHREDRRPCYRRRKRKRRWNQLGTGPAA